MADLLISVRSLDEAAAALAGGAAIIDVKEPRRGSLGRADDDVIDQVVAFVQGRRPVSAAYGELLDELPAYAGQGLAFVKWGLSGCGRRSDWPGLLERWRARSKFEMVFVAYADWQCAQAPPVEDVVALGCKNPGSVLLLDTSCKDPDTLTRGRRPTLLDWMSASNVSDLCERCRTAQVRVALAGSLGIAEVRELLPARPSWFAVRGAVCAAGRREGQVDEAKVRQLARLVANVV